MQSEEERRKERLLEKFGYKGVRVGERNRERLSRRMDSGVRQFSDILTKTTRINKIFVLKGGKKAIPLRELNQVKVSVSRLTPGIVNKLASICKFSSSELTLESKLYRLMELGRIPLLTDCDYGEIPALDDKPFENCILMYPEERKAYFPSDGESMGIIKEKLNGLLQFTGNAPLSCKSLKERRVHYKSEIEKFSEKLAQLYIEEK